MAFSSLRCLYAASSASSEEPTVAISIADEVCGEETPKIRRYIATTEIQRWGGGEKMAQSAIEHEMQKSRKKDTHKICLQPPILHSRGGSKCVGNRRRMVVRTGGWVVATTLKDFVAVLVGFYLAVGVSMINITRSMSLFSPICLSASCFKISKLL